MVSINNSINLNVTNALKNEHNYFTIKKYTFNNNEYKIICQKNIKNEQQQYIANKDKKKKSRKKNIIIEINA